MPLMRIEPKKDAATALYYLEIFYPADAGEPLVTTEPRYMSAAAAENDLIAIIATRGNRPQPAQDSSRH
jgi:hypothetical protein